MDQRQFFLRDILTVIFKHKGLITTFPIVVFIAVFVGNYVWPPTFESAAQIQLMRGREVSQTDSTVTHADQSMVMVQLSVEDVNTELQLLSSDDLLRRVVTKHGYDKDPDFPYSDWFLYQPYRAVRWTFNSILYTLDLKKKPDYETIAIKELRDRIRTEPVRDSHVLQVKMRMGDAKKAQEILRYLIEEYKVYHIEVFANDKSVTFFEDQKKKIGEALAESQVELKKARTDNNINMLEEQEKLLLGQYAESQKILTQLDAIGKVVDKAAAHGDKDVDNEVISNLSGQTDSTVVREMQLRLLELMLEQNRVVQSLGEKHPQVSSIKKQVAIAKDNLVTAIANTKSTTEQKLVDVKAALGKLNEAKADYELKTQNTAILSKQFDYYSQKLEEARVGKALGDSAISNIRVISGATLPIDPVIPNKLMNLLLALVGGIVAALAIAFFLDYLDHGLKTPEDVEFYTKLSPLATFWKSAGKKLDPREAERLAIMLEADHVAGDSHLFEVTSSIGGESAPAVAQALADALAKNQEARTLLIDFTGEAGSSKLGAGVSDVLVGNAKMDDVFTTGDTLTVVSRGGSADTYLWGSKSMESLVGELRSRYQYIVFSVGPILQSHDAIKLSRHVDGVLIAIKANSTRREVVSRAVDSLKEGKSKIIGAVLTDRTQAIPQAVYRRI